MSAFFDAMGQAMAPMAPLFAVLALLAAFAILERIGRGDG